MIKTVRSRAVRVQLCGLFLQLLDQPTWLENRLGTSMLSAPNGQSPCLSSMVTCAYKPLAKLSNRAILWSDRGEFATGLLRTAASHVDIGSNVLAQLLQPTACNFAHQIIICENMRL